jgi:hypothetical protein
MFSAIGGFEMNKMCDERSHITVYHSTQDLKVRRG